MLQLIENGYSAAMGCCVIVLGTQFQRLQFCSQTKCATRENGEARDFINRPTRRLVKYKYPGLLFETFLIRISAEKSAILHELSLCLPQFTKFDSEFSPRLCHDDFLPNTF